MTDAAEGGARRVMAGLMPFQRATVDHVIDRFYRARDASRFLVADETGLGKTIVARGVIARAIEELEHDDSVERIDVVYICSNADLARQNLAKLDVTGGRHIPFASRLTLLAKHSHRLQRAPRTASGKPVNLISFTPGTSFESGWRSGKAEERAMLYLLLEEELDLGDPTGPRARAACRVLQGTLGKSGGLAWHVNALRRELPDGPDPAVRSAFVAVARAPGPLRGPSMVFRFEELIERALDAGVNGERDRGLAHDALPLIGDLRAALARQGAQLLEPDLVILDEFQRFRQLLDRGTEAGELAHQLYDFGVSEDLGPESTDGPGSALRLGTARTLLLSASPYRPFTYAEEGEDHRSDFLDVVRWLGDGAPGQGDLAARVAVLLAEYREQVVAGRTVEAVTGALRSELLRVMSRTERPRALASTSTRELRPPLDPVSPDALLGYVALRNLAGAVDAPVGVEYWKSSAFFVNFWDGYKVADKVRAALDDPTRADEVRGLLARTRHLDLTGLREGSPLPTDLGNARLRRLADETVGAGWWALLWVPPSLPYLEAGGPYRAIGAGTGAPMTKRLVFSSWSATPSAVATLLSHEADRLSAGTAHEGAAPSATESDRGGVRSRLAYRISTADRPATMAHLVLFWPMPGLAAQADPLTHRRLRGGPLTADELVAAVGVELGTGRNLDVDADEASHWFEAFAREDSLPPDLAGADAAEIARTLQGADPDAAEEEEGTGASESLLRHVELALTCRTTPQDGPLTDGVLRALAEVAAHSPANIAYRALGRVAGIDEGSASGGVTAGGLWRAAAALAAALRSLFSRPGTVQLLDQLLKDTTYWRAVLRYCAWGNLQAVLDEYIHHLVAATGEGEMDDERLLAVAHSAGAAIALRPARLQVFDPENPHQQGALTAHFALRYGGRRQSTETESLRLPQVRQAFNSPFRPFVLASTSVGQEGIDFHWWCHAIMHWNTPTSPVDFEQREGRVDRYDGHAVRLNIAQRHREEIFASGDPDPWSAAYRIAAADAADGPLGDFAPHWVYPGEARIERHLAPFALSTDEARLARVKRDVALYRLTLGQPRQEDLVELLAQEHEGATADELEALRLDLRPGQRA